MPPVRNLTPSAPYTPAAPAGRVTVHETPSQAVATAPKNGDGAALALPSWAMAVPTVPNDMPATASGVYIGQLQGDTAKRKALEAAGCSDGDYYICNDGQYTPLPEFRFFLLRAGFFRTKMNAAGDIIFASRDAHNRDGDEHVVALIVADVNGTLVPAKADFRRAQWQAAGAAIDAVRDAASPEFPGKSDAHRLAAAFPAPCGRVVTNVDVERRISRTSGKAYFLSTGRVEPSSVADMQRLADAMQNADFLKAVEDAQKGYDARVSAIEKLCR